MGSVNGGQVRDREQRLCTATICASRQWEPRSRGRRKRYKKVSSDGRSRLDGEVDIEFRWVILGLSNDRLRLGLEHLARLGDCLVLRSTMHPACLFLLHLDIPLSVPESSGGDRDIVDHVLENGSTRVECTSRAKTNLGDICGNHRRLGQARGRKGSGEGMLYGQREAGINAVGIGELGRTDKRRLS